MNIQKQKFVTDPTFVVPSWRCTVTSEDAQHFVSLFFFLGLRVVGVSACSDAKIIVARNNTWSDCGKT